MEGGRVRSVGTMNALLVTGLLASVFSCIDSGPIVEPDQAAAFDVRELVQVFHAAAEKASDHRRQENARRLADAVELLLTNYADGNTVTVQWTPAPRVPPGTNASFRRIIESDGH